MARPGPESSGKAYTRTYMTMRYASCTYYLVHFFVAGRSLRYLTAMSEMNYRLEGAISDIVPTSRTW